MLEGVNISWLVVVIIFEFKGNVLYDMVSSGMLVNDIIQHPFERGKDCEVEWLSPTARGRK